MKTRLFMTLLGIVPALTGNPASAQSDYRNLEVGHPARVSDATPTERGALDLDITTFRIERLSLGRYRAQYEPRVAYGLLPRTEVSVRVPSFYRERSVSPRGGIAGVGLGAEHQLLIEGLSRPALALAGEVFVPTGPNAVQTAVSLKALVTRSFNFGRVHLNGSYGTFGVRTAPEGGSLAPPVIDGPCNLQPLESSLPFRSSCSYPVTPLPTSGIEAAEGGISTKGRWAAGVAVDKSFALRSLLLIADVFAEKFEGIGRPMEWSAEGGGRKQVTQFLVIDAGIGRKFAGFTPSWYAVVGTTLTLAINL